MTDKEIDEMISRIDPKYSVVKRIKNIPFSMEFKVVRFLSTNPEYAVSDVEFMIHFDITVAEFFECLSQLASEKIPVCYTGRDLYISFDYRRIDMSFSVADCLKDEIESYSVKIRKLSNVRYTDLQGNTE